jgi:hypothetical protein
MGTMKPKLIEAITEELRIRIRTGQYSIRPFPSAQSLTADEELQKKLQSKRPPSLQTIRTALGILVGEGLIASTPNNPRAGMQICVNPHSLIGLICCTPRLDFMGRVIEGADDELRRCNERKASAKELRLVIALAPSSEIEGQLIRKLRDEVDGLVILPVRDSNRSYDDFKTLKERRLPTVVLGRGLQSGLQIGQEPKAMYAPLVAYSELEIAN